MGLPAFRAQLLVGVLCTGTCMIAAENRHNDQCSGTYSRHDCVHLGEVSDSVSLVGTFESCTESAGYEPLTSREDPGSSVVYQFDMTRSGNVRLQIDGLGDAWVIKGGTTAFRVNANVNSIDRRFDRGRYTLIGRAPLCRNVREDWSRGFRILIDPKDGEQSVLDSPETADGTDRIVVMIREERKPLLARVTNWTYIVLSIILSTVVLVIVLGT